MSTIDWSDLEDFGFDIVIFGDGSGMNEEGGWACLICDVGRHRVMPLLGSCSRGTNNTMELTPYIEALAYLRREGRKNQDVLICSDSSWVVNGVMQESRRKANSHLWAALEDLIDDFHLEAQHFERNSLPPLSWSDEHAGNMRVHVKEYIRTITLPESPEPQHMFDLQG